jgi:16S rRNA (guanine1207-N2)-methyltransferase
MNREGYGLMSHYFDHAPSVASRPGTVELVLPDLRVSLATDRGVFSPGAVDAGTKLLLLEGPAPAGSTLLDLGCGYGPIAVALAKRAPSATVWAVDVNSRARALAAANAASCGVEARVRIAAPEEVSDDVRFDEIWSNPPIRIGKSALQSMLTTWLDRLADGGRAWLVVQKHLGSDSLHRWLESSGWPTRRIASRAGYRVLEVEAR